MNRVWYLIEEVEHYFDRTGKFVEYITTYYLYNIKEESRYVGSPLLRQVLSSGVEYNKVDSHTLFNYCVIRGQVPLFEPCDPTTFYYDYKTIKKALPKVKVGETFVKEAVTLTNSGTIDKYVEWYEHYQDPIKHYVDCLQEYKECRKNKEYPVSLTEDEITSFENDDDMFLTATLLYASENKPTIEGIKKSYPELLI